MQPLLIGCQVTSQVQAFWRHLLRCPANPGRKFFHRKPPGSMTPNPPVLGEDVCIVWDALGYLSLCAWPKKKSTGFFDSGLYICSFNSFNCLFH